MQPLSIIKTLCSKSQRVLLNSRDPHEQVFKDAFFLERGGQLKEDRFAIEQTSALYEYNEEGDLTGLRFDIFECDSFMDEIWIERDHATLCEVINPSFHFLIMSRRYDPPDLTTNN